jgi:hypothetical protein
LPESFKKNSVHINTLYTYKVDLTRHPKFPLAFGELASGHFPHCTTDDSSAGFQG